ncbi:restriction endonuclease [Thalassomonas actiniarum]|uniref:Restriction endonuclease n=1 Tax=Thalassomonas actiniarum TaxID=485447 RepID=A0AAE9YTC8_9GAMM|nr:restriction endonuclease [Thalassomonas actiniarum]WDE00741.1 restriction endonuclease [Thalassomonas actiniarum]
MITLNLEKTSLDVDQIYGGSRNGNASDDPLPKLLGVDNQAGFRHLGKRPELETLKMIVLKSSFKEPDWPDFLDTETGIFTYYGDRRSPGELHDTPRQGNKILSNLFQETHTPQLKDHFPPIFVFGNTGVYRDVRFIGLAVPGAENIGQDDDLVALWRATGSNNIRFQNYRAKFTILDVSTVSRLWIKDIQSGKNLLSENAPKPWVDWVLKRKYTPLKAPHSIEIRDKDQQTPSTPQDIKIIELIYSTYKKDPYAFELFAIKVAQLMLPNIKNWELTRPWRDGGRDATGIYQIGTGGSSIDVEFALEAKCYQTKSGVGVKELSRLISRLRHRQFGVLVTTSYLSNQAYKELKEDNHPVVIISAKDIVDTLKCRIGTFDNIHTWLCNVTIN